MTMLTMLILVMVMMMVVIVMMVVVMVMVVAMMMMVIIASRLRMRFLRGEMLLQEHRWKQGDFPPLFRSIFTLEPFQSFSFVEFKIFQKCKRIPIFLKPDLKKTFQPEEEGAGRR